MQNKLHKLYNKFSPSPSIFNEVHVVKDESIRVPRSWNPNQEVMLAPCPLMRVWIEPTGRGRQGQDLLGRQAMIQGAARSSKLIERCCSCLLR